MKMEQLASIIDGLTGGLSSILARKEADELKGFAASLHRWAQNNVGQFAEIVNAVHEESTRLNQAPKEFLGFVASIGMELTKSGLSPKDFQKLVSTTLSDQRGSGEALLERIKAVKAGTLADTKQLIAEVKKLKANDLKSLMQSIGVSPGKTVAENRQRMEDYLQADRQPAGALPAPAQSVEQARTDFTTIQNKLKEISFEDIRAEAAKLEKYDSGVLEEVARKLGYSTITGSKEKIIKELTDVLERQKRSLVQTSLM